jgi:hypothetical protein
MAHLPANSMWGLSESYAAGFVFAMNAEGGPEMYGEPALIPTGRSRGNVSPGKPMGGRGKHPAGFSTLDRASPPGGSLYPDPESKPIGAR